MKFLTLIFVLFFSVGAHAEMMAEEVESQPPQPIQLPGKLLVRGQSGTSQLFARVKAVKCEKSAASGPDQYAVVKSSCKGTAVYFGLNQATDVEAGLYIVGFENSIYPGYVEVETGKTLSLDLIKIDIPRAAVEAKVFRDFTKLGEQRKQYFAMWGTGTSFFQQSEYEFGDFYLTKWPLRPAIPSLSYEYCERKGPALSEEAVEICEAWGAQSFEELSDMFEFGTTGRFKQFWVGRPGGVFKFFNKRHLVSAPLSSGEFVSVFPGNYSIEAKTADGKIRVSSVNVGQSVNAYGTIPMHSLVGLKIASQSINVAGSDVPVEASVAPVTCEAVRLWKTEARSYCRRDSDEGCNRATAIACQPMIDRGL